MASDHHEGAGGETLAPFSLADAPPIWSRSLHPHRALSLQGRKNFLLLVGLLMLLPLIAVAGTAFGWLLLPFLLLPMLLIWLAFYRFSYDAQLYERLLLWPDRLSVEQVRPDGEVQSWQANPYWVQIRLHENAQIEKYLTLKGNGREIELGRFLSPDEREALYHDLLDALAQARGAPPLGG